MEKGDPRALELLNDVMRVRGWDRDQLADRVGKKRRTIDGVMRGELAMAQDLEKHLQHLLENGAGEVSLKLQETPPRYDLLKKVIFIQERAGPEILEILDTFLEAVCEKLGWPRKKKRDESPALSPRPGAGERSPFGGENLVLYEELSEGETPAGRTPEPESRDGK